MDLLGHAQLRQGPAPAVRPHRPPRGTRPLPGGAGGRAGMTDAGQPLRSGPARPSPAELGESVLERVGSRAEAEVAVSRGRYALTRFANSHIHQNVAEDHVGVRIRVVAGGRMASSSTNRADAEGLDRLVEGALEAA